MLRDETLGQMISEFTQLHNESGITLFERCGRAAFRCWPKTIEIHTAKEDFYNPQGSSTTVDCAGRGNWYNRGLPEEVTI